MEKNGMDGENFAEFCISFRNSYHSFLFCAMRKKCAKIYVVGRTLYENPKDGAQEKLRAHNASRIYNVMAK